MYKNPQVVTQKKTKKNSYTAVIFQNKENKCKKNHKWWILKAKAKIPQRRAFKEEMGGRERAGDGGGCGRRGRDLREGLGLPTGC